MVISTNKFKYATNKHSITRGQLNIKCFKLAYQNSNLPSKKAINITLIDNWLREVAMHFLTQHGSIFFTLKKEFDNCWLLYKITDIKLWIKWFTNSRRCEVRDAVRGRVDVAEEPGEERSSIPPKTGYLNMFWWSIFSRWMRW